MSQIVLLHYRQSNVHYALSYCGQEKLKNPSDEYKIRSCVDRFLRARSQTYIEINVIYIIRLT